MALVNLGPETEVKEYKKSIGEIKEGIISIASILNKHGSGELYFGVTNDGTVLGQEIGDETLRKVSQAIGYHVKPPIYPEICVKEFDGRKTVYVKFKGDRQPYLAYNIPRIRVADEDLVMDQDMYDSLLRQRDDKRKSWESQLSGYTAEDVDMEAFQSYLKKAREAGRITFDTDDKEIVLKKLKLMSGRYLLNAGAALFCKTDINELKMATFATNERLTFTDIRIYSGSIIELADKAEKYVLDAMHWRAEIVGMKRVEIPEIPPEAVREAIINSFAHRVIESGQSNEVAIFKNRIEIYNYGTFPAHMTPEQYFDGNEQPVRRNPLIAGTLYYSKDMENFATGLKRIYDACESAGCRVEFQKKTHGFCVVFYRRGYEESIEGEDKEQERNQAEPTGSQAEPIGSQAEPTGSQAEPTGSQVEPTGIQARPTGSQASGNRMESLVEFCSVPRSRDQMQQFLGITSKGTFRRLYLSVLLREGRLKMIFPDKPNSPKQKYVKV